MGRNERKLKSLVKKTINFLAPYFEVNKRKKELGFPSVMVGCIPRCNIYGEIYLPHDLEKEKNAKYTLGHEVGHWIHLEINPSSLISTNMREIVAIYSGIIYQNRGNPIQNPRFNLAELARMSPTNLQGLKEAEDFYTSNKQSEHQFPPVFALT